MNVNYECSYCNVVKDSMTAKIFGSSPVVPKHLMTAGVDSSWLQLLLKASPHYTRSES